MVEGKKTILVIDDERNVRESLGYYLEDLEYNILLAENGKVGVDIFDSVNIDMVLVDLLMPEMNGYEVIDHITSKSPGTPVIVISVLNKTSDVIQVVHQGAWDYLLKPLTDFSLMVNTIENGFKRAKLIRAGVLQNVVQEKDGTMCKHGSFTTLCSHCKSYRDETGAWRNIEYLIEKLTQTKTSHGICDDCIDEYYSDYIYQTS